MSIADTPVARSKFDDLAAAVSGEELKNATLLSEPGLNRLKGKKLVPQLRDALVDSLLLPFESITVRYCG